MSKKLEIPRLRQLLMRLEKNLTQRQICLDMHINRKTVAKYSKILKKRKLLAGRLLALSDGDLYQAVDDEKQAVVEPHPNERLQFLLGQIEYIRSELELPGVTLHLLWQEYKGSGQSTYGYASFCKHIRSALLKQPAVYHKRYQPAEVLMIDFAGDKLSYIDRETGQPVSCVVFVSVMGYSNYTYAEVLPAATTTYLIRALSNNLRFLGGVPLTVLTDNMAQLVKKADRYEPAFTEAAELWANHNGVMLQTARVAHPRDKSVIELHVSIIYQRIYATLRNQSFYCLKDLSQAVEQKLKEHNQKNFQNRTYSRYDRFTVDEQPRLLPLPKEEYKMQKCIQAKVQKNYHIMLGEDKHFYSVPYMYVGKIVQVIYTTDVVEIYSQMIRIAVHPRQPGAFGYTTTEGHMPESHQAYAKSAGYKRDDFLSMAAKVGKHTHAYVEKMLSSRKYEAHAYIGCLGLLRLGDHNQYGRSRLESACCIGLHLERTNYKTVEKILKNSVDLQHASAQKPAESSHENLRGPEAF